MKLWSKKSKYAKTKNTHIWPLQTMRYTKHLHDHPLPPGPATLRTHGLQLQRPVQPSCSPGCHTTVVFTVTIKYGTCYIHIQPEAWWAPKPLFHATVLRASLCPQLEATSTRLSELPRNTFSPTSPSSPQVAVVSSLRGSKQLLVSCLPVSTPKVQLSAVGSASAPTPKFNIPQ